MDTDRPNHLLRPNFARFVNTPLTLYPHIVSKGDVASLINAFHVKHPERCISPFYNMLNPPFLFMRKVDHRKEKKSQRIIFWALEFTFLLSVFVFIANLDWCMASVQIENKQFSSISSSRKNICHSQVCLNVPLGL